MPDDLTAVADAVLRVHDRMESSGAKQVPVERVLDYLTRRYDFDAAPGGDGTPAARSAEKRVAAVLNEHHGDLWVMGPRDESRVDLPTYVLVPEEMAKTIEDDVLERG
jgi:hypothetical protein